MPRDIPLGNGQLLLCFDDRYYIRDLYFPHVGQENHLSGNRCRLGVWCEGRFSWVDEAWQRELRYQEDTLASSVILRHPEIGLTLRCADAVDFHENVLVREIRVENHEKRGREIRIFFSHSFDLSGNSIGDTAAYDPRSGAVVHYKGARYLLVSGQDAAGGGLSQFAVGQKNVKGREGTFRDAEDGELSGNTIAQGSVDSVFSLHCTVAAAGEATVWYWLAAGESWEEVRRLDTIVRNKGPRVLLDRTAAYWRLWVRKETPALEVLPPAVAALYRRSLLILRTQIDHDGGILAANDSDVILFNRDTYSYIWPRDGALVANALDLAGYPALSQRFYQFAARVIDREGYFLQKYNPDGTLASSWHPWSTDGATQLPIQEDETGLVLWALWRHFVLFRDIEFIKPLYRPLIKQAADFLCTFRDKKTDLPLPSWDLWEERRGVLAFTVGSVFGGLTAAALFCRIFGENDRAAHYRQTASAIRDAASKHLWRPELNRFCRMLTPSADGTATVDPVLDASLWGLCAFGMYSADDPRMTATMDTMWEALWVRSGVGGLARYEGDGYHRSSDHHPGNPWFLCTLWFADYLTDQATREEELAESLRILAWVADHALPSGVLAEQVHPDTGQPLSVSPLTWSHATFVASCQRVIRRLAQLRRCPTCGFSLIHRAGEEDWLEKLYTEECNTIQGVCSLR